MDRRTAEKASMLLAKIDRYNRVVERLSFNDKPVCFVAHDEFTVRERIGDIDTDALALIIDAYTNAINELEEELEELGESEECEEL